MFNRFEGLGCLKDSSEMATKLPLIESPLHPKSTEWVKGTLGLLNPIICPTQINLTLQFLDLLTFPCFSEPGFTALSSATTCCLSRLEESSDTAVSRLLASWIPQLQLAWAGASPQWWLLSPSPIGRDCPQVLNTNPTTKHPKSSFVRFQIFVGLSLFV